MRKIIGGFLLVVLLISFSGCQAVIGSIKGFSDGLKEDWKAFKKADDEFKEDYW